MEEANAKVADKILLLNAALAQRTIDEQSMLEALERTEQTEDLVFKLKSDVKDAQLEVLKLFNHFATESKKRKEQAEKELRRRTDEHDADLSRLGVDIVELGEKYSI